MKVFNGITKILIFPAYYLIHKNIVFGLFHKFFVKNFYYKNFSFNLNVKNIPLSSRSSFIFKTYEYNDRKLVEKHINHKNKCIIIGGGLGFIPTIAFHKSKNKILVFEINKIIIRNLRKNLVKNNCKFKLFNNNLVLQKKNKTSNYFISKNFLATSQYLKDGELSRIDNIYSKKILNFEKFNTLIIDGEGVEEYYLNNLNKINHIEYIIFELHNHLFNIKKINSLFQQLRKNKFILIDKCFNSYFFKKED
tara:strand:- start:1595 stop:2344 length:750 start_codon:yes stop_codon:yes gene_type:complete